MDVVELNKMARLVSLRLTENPEQANAMLGCNHVAPEVITSGSENDLVEAMLLVNPG